jgi:uncharacterized protein
MSGSGKVKSFDEDGMNRLAPAEIEIALGSVRQAIESQWSGTAPPPALAGGCFDENCGVFVSLHKAGHLRGCMGWLDSGLPLGSTLLRVALIAAFDDPRFAALRADEWPQCEVEISVLGELRQVEGPGAVVAGRDGVRLTLGERSAVFLPQVAAEQGWTREELLTQLCRKAGLPRDAWRLPDCRLEVFEAQVLR